MNFYQFMIPRLNGIDMEKNFGYYLGLVRKGIGGFIIFGGELETIRKGIRELQMEARLPLFIASDLEQGLGQQIKGGTLFPPAMAVAAAVSGAQVAVRSGSELMAPELKPQGAQLLKKIFTSIACEAEYAGINTVFAPVLDINTNPQNPIIATRSFGEDAGMVSYFGCKMVRVLQNNGIIACGKHFPGHGDTETDSHIGLPVILKDLPVLEKTELVPFRKAVDAGVKMIMLGHLSIPAIEPTGLPVSLSAHATAYLRKMMGFRGIIISDALNMQGLKGLDLMTEEEASLRALCTGTDLLLHPTDPANMASYLEQSGYLPEGKTMRRLERFRRRHCVQHAFKHQRCSFSEHINLSEEVTKKAITVNGVLGPVKKPLLVILNDDEFENGIVLKNELRRRLPSVECRIYNKQTPFLEIQPGDKAQGKELILSVFSGIRAWKGGASGWLKDALKIYSRHANILISFGSPYLLSSLETEAAKIFAYWNSEQAQKSVAEIIASCDEQ
jgi:beta-glucosidase-like glycosyl hydrolase